MSKIEEIQTAIESLSESDYLSLRTWFTERDWAKWDQEIAYDLEHNRLDFLLREALDENAEGKTLAI
jgi:hypothetical protein